MKGRIVLREGDITEEEVDAIVNAANSQLVLGAGVAGAIREKGGPAIQAECDAIGSIALGDAVVTGAGRLRARFVIHAAGMPPGGAATETSVRASVRRSLELAAQRGCRTIAIPAIGAGIGGLAVQRCAEILIEEASAHLAGETTLEEVRFVLFGEPAYRVFECAQDESKVRAAMATLGVRGRGGGRGGTGLIDSARLRLAARSALPRLACEAKGRNAAPGDSGMAYAATRG